MVLHERRCIDGYKLLLRVHTADVYSHIHLSTQRKSALKYHQVYWLFRKSYLNSKPLGMQTLYDTFCKLCINCFFIMGVISMLKLIIELFFGPVNRFVASVTAFAAYISSLTTFTCLFCVQIVRYLYLTYPAALDYYDETKTIMIFKCIVLVSSATLSFIEVNSFYNFEIH